MTNDITELMTQFKYADQEATQAITEYIEALRILANDLEKNLSKGKLQAIDKQLEESTKNLDKMALACCVKIASRELAASLLSK